MSAVNVCTICICLLGKSTNADDGEAQSTTGAEDSKIEKKTQETIDSTKTTHAEDESTADGKQPATLEDANQLVLFIFFNYLCSVVNSHTLTSVRVGKQSAWHIQILTDVFSS